MADGFPRWLITATASISLMLPSVAIAIDCSKAEPLGPNLLQNAGFEALSGDDAIFPAWQHWRWAGDFELAALPGTAFAGQSAARISGFGPGRFGLFQKLRLEPGQYRWTSAVASQGLRPGEWGRSSDQLLILQPSEETWELPLLSGDQDWRHSRVEFAVETAQELTLYWRSYGPGHLFVDDTSLRQLETCTAPEPPRLRLQATGRALDYEPPLTRDDMVLAGYCDRPDYASRPLCQRREDWPTEPLRRQQARVLADFEQAKGVFVGDAWQREASESLGGLAARIRSGHYLLANDSTGLVTDWRGYDYLRLRVHNPGPAAEEIYIEIRDQQTRGYWSRVNWTALVAPGTQTISVPLQVFVGERSVIRERRRLDLATITTLVVSAAQANVDLIVDDIRLDLEPPWQQAFPELLRWDFGSRISPVFAGFVAVDPTDYYTPTRGYGLAAGSSIAGAQDRRHPENLLRDWVEIRSGGFDVDLPNGRYWVWLVWEDPGYWEDYPVVLRREVWAEGQQRLSEEPSEAAFWAAYYRHEDDEDLPGDDIWARYIRPRYAPKRFAVELHDGQLNLRLSGAPRGVTLSALMIYPEAQKSAGEAFEAELSRALRRQFYYEYSESPSPGPSAALPTGPQPDWFSRHALEPVYPTEWPGAAAPGTVITAALAGGETQALTVSLRGRQADRLVRWELPLEGIEVQAHSVRNKLQRRTFDGTAYQNAPLILDPLKPALALPAQLTRRLWFSLRAKADAAAGLRHSTLRLHFASGARLEIPVQVRLYPFTLPPADQPIGYLGVAPGYPSGPRPSIARKRAAELDTASRLLAAHEMTAVTGGLGGPQLIGFDDEGRPRIDFATADLAMAAYKPYFRYPVNSYFGLGLRGLPEYRVSDTRGPFGQPFEPVLSSFLGAVSEHAQQQDWLPLVINIGDEPRGEALANSLELARVYKTVAPEQPLSVFTSFSHSDAPQAALLEHVDWLLLTHHSEASLKKIRQAGRRCSLYNLRDRYHRGLYLHRLKQLGCRGYYQFAFSSVGADPYYALDAREDDLVAVFTHSSGEFRRSLDLLQFREAIDDYRYWLALENALAQQPTGHAASAARQDLAGWLATMRIGHDQPVPWNNTELDAIRQRIAAHILALGVQVNG